MNAVPVNACQALPEATPALLAAAESAARMNRQGQEVLDRDLDRIARERREAALSGASLRVGS